ncbi:helix-turn-helix transcriptional regulator [Catenulispora sp. NF23]|uniref:Helix-turn-helix transcriptional regulator n=1 Tax=Catenulispora pinistramenti TaxID=2705254 RepID=A0ABS5KJ25_9ACTN|nr:helix-turn-helix transcriptional regulator [Catenulispora pinistramenti]MBS2532212.1 helix-turn-helix transcriptional regulator [Catenulispora pinistramenti]MBS2546387.1 helix-turn-helix transcriptional regulator [Catenulispora pinistramenti]
MSSLSSVLEARKALGRRLRDIRRDAGLTARALAGLAGWHESKISKIEHGTTNPSDDDLRVWATHCEVPEQAEDLIATARGIAGMYTDWRRMERTGLKLAQQSVAPIYERTRWFRIYSSTTLPGLIQTEGYTRAVLRSVQERRGLTDDVEDAVAVRMERQHVLRLPDRRFAFLVEESVIRATVGGTDTMLEQLAHLLAVSIFPNVSLGIVPSSADRTSIRAVESFYMHDEAQVNVELVSAYLTLTRPSEIAMYAHVFRMLKDLAVHGPAATKVITSAIDALG